MLQPFEEELDANPQDAGDLQEPARPDPVGALFVFLDLLEGQPEGIPQRLLTHAEGDTAPANPQCRYDGRPESATFFPRISPRDITKLSPNRPISKTKSRFIV